MHTIRVRRADASDAKLLAEIGMATFRETFAAQNSADDMRAYLESNFSAGIQIRELADPRSTSFVAEVDGETAGYAQVWEGGAPACVGGQDSIEIRRLYVLERFQGRGIGAALMKCCYEAAAERRARTLWLGVWERNEKAKQFYFKVGFVECGEHVFSLGADPQRDLILERRL